MNIFVGNLSHNVRAEDLRKLFNGFGTVLDASLAVDKSSQKPLGHAKVYVVPDDAARAAITELQLAPLRGCPIRLREYLLRASGERRINKGRIDADRRQDDDRRREHDVASSSWPLPR